MPWWSSLWSQLSLSVLMFDVNWHYVKLFTWMSLCVAMLLLHDWLIREFNSAVVSGTQNDMSVIKYDIKQRLLMAGVINRNRHDERAYKHTRRHTHSLTFIMNFCMAWEKKSIIIVKSEKCLTKFVLNNQQNERRKHGEKWARGHSCVFSLLPEALWRCAAINNYLNNKQLFILRLKTWFDQRNLADCLFGINIT